MSDLDYLIVLVLLGVLVAINDKLSSIKDILQAWEEIRKKGSGEH